MRKLMRKRILVPVVAIAAIAVAGIAVAYFTASGTGSGTATGRQRRRRHDHERHVRPTRSTRAARRPSDSRSTTRSSDTAVQVDKVVADTSAGTNGITGLPDGCTASDFSFGDVTVGAVDRRRTARPRTGTLRWPNTSAQPGRLPGRLADAPPQGGQQRHLADRQRAGDAPAKRPRLLGPPLTHMHAHLHDTDSEERQGATDPDAARCPHLPRARRLGGRRAVAGPKVATPTITSGPSGATSATSATFAFVAGTRGDTLECSLDGAAFAACTSPKAYSGLRDGAHTFRVRERTEPARSATPPRAAGRSTRVRRPRRSSCRSRPTRRARTARRSRSPTARRTSPTSASSTAPPTPPARAP